MKLKKHHLLNFALLSTTLVLSASCMKKEGFEDDHGPAVPAEQIQSALIEAWGNVDAATIAKGEFVYTEKEQSIEGMPAKVVYQEAITVSNRVVQPAEIEYTLIKQTNEIVDGQSKLSTKEEKLKIPNTLNTVTTQQLGILNLQSLLMACIPDTNWDVSCHNLKTYRATEPAPSLVAQQANCGGIANCKLNKKYVSFDLVLKTPLANGQTVEEKVTYKIGVSDQVPYLSRMTDFCFKGLVKVGNPAASYLVSLCDKVQNFKAGQN